MRRSKVQAKAATFPHRLVIATTCLFLGGLLWAASAKAQDDEIIISHGISTFGELKYDADFPHFDYVNPDAPKGGSFSTWAFGTFDSMTPYILKGQPASLASAQFESLMGGGADEPDAMYGLIAETIEYPKSRQWAAFNMREEARFSDGSPVTAEDVIFSYEVLLEKGQPRYAALFKDIESAVAESPLRVKFTFKDGVNTRELPQLVAGLPIFSKDEFADKDFAEPSMTPWIGSGPYILKAVDEGRSVTIQRRDDYWGENLNLNIGQNNFDEIKVEYFGDYTAAVVAFKAGEYTFRSEASSKSWATGYDYPAIDKGWVVKTVLPDGTPTGTQGFWFNMRRDKFKDIRVRQAIGMMFNFEWSNQALFYGLYARTDSFWENSHMQAEGEMTDAERALLAPVAEHFPATLFDAPAFVPNVSRPDKLDRSALRKASRLLDEAGWVLDGKFRKKDGEVLSVEFINDSPSFERIISPYVENLITLGVDAKLKSIDPAQDKERRKVFDFDIYTQGFAFSLTPGIELRQIFTSENANVEGSFNLAGLENPGIDALVSNVEGAKTRADLDVAVKALDRALRSLHIWVPQWYKGVHTIAYLDIYDYPDPLPPYALGTTSFWWYNAEKAEKLKAEGAY